MDDSQSREEFDTGLSKIRQEIKSRLVPHGLYGSVTDIDTGPTGGVPAGSTIEIVVKGRAVGRSFDRRQVEDCCLRVKGPALLAIISMVDELSA